MPYRSNKGNIKTYEEWSEEADRFYHELGCDGEDKGIDKPLDWWKRWTKILGLREEN